MPTPDPKGFEKLGPQALLTFAAIVTLCAIGAIFVAIKPTDIWGYGFMLIAESLVIAPVGMVLFYLYRHSLHQQPSHPLIVEKANYSQVHGLITTWVKNGDECVHEINEAIGDDTKSLMIKRLMPTEISRMMISNETEWNKYKAAIKEIIIGGEGGRDYQDQSIYGKSMIADYNQATWELVSEWYFGEKLPDTTFLGYHESILQTAIIIIGETLDGSRHISKYRKCLWLHMGGMDPRVVQGWAFTLQDNDDTPISREALAAMEHIDQMFEDHWEQVLTEQKGVQIFPGHEAAWNQLNKKLEEFWGQQATEASGAKSTAEIIEMPHQSNRGVK